MARHDRATERSQYRTAMEVMCYVMSGQQQQSQREQSQLLRARRRIASQNEKLGNQEIQLACLAEQVSTLEQDLRHERRMRSAADATIAQKQHVICNLEHQTQGLQRIVSLQEGVICNISSLARHDLTML